VVDYLQDSPLHSSTENAVNYKKHSKIFSNTENAVNYKKHPKIFSKTCLKHSWFEPLRKYYLVLRQHISLWA
jgi:hypothetical protein